MNRDYKYTFAGRIKSRLETYLTPFNRPLLIFSVEGILFALITSMINNNNNLFALRLGATDFQVSFVSSIPQFVGVLVLIPVGILTDRMFNKQKMVIASLISLSIFYVLIGFVPVLGSYKLLAFLILLSLSIGPLTSYNASWQAYFSDVVPFEGRNRVLTMRTGGMFFISICTPLLTGALLASVLDNNKKIQFHQIFYFTAAVILIMQILTLRQLKDGHAKVRNYIKFSEIKSTVMDLIDHKPFMKFLGAALFFYITWHADWTLYFLGQVNYLKMDEAWLSYVSIGSAVAQFLTIGLWSRVNERIGPRFGIIFGNLGLALCPISMIVGTSLPSNYALVVFLVMNTFANLALANVSLNLPQCLLLSIPERNKTLSISIYTVFVTLSNAIMPMAGVRIYSIFGGDLRALQGVFWALFLLRIVSTTIWFFNWKISRREEITA